MDRDALEIPIQYVKGVGPQRARLLSRLNIRTVSNAISYLPYRYEDRQNIRKIHHLRSSHLETVVGKVIAANLINLPRGRVKLFELTVSDGTGILKGKWFNQPYMKKHFTVGQEVILSGIVKPNAYRGIGFEMDNPEYESVSEDGDDCVHTSRIVPIYKTTAGLSARLLRTIMFTIVNNCLNRISDPLPAEMLARYGLPSLRESVLNVHFPEGEQDIEALNRGVSLYRKRLAFNELLNLELGIAVMKRGEAREKGIAFDPDGHLLNRLIEKLPYRLTNAQQRVFNEILSDMKKPFPMNRLLQGDVGCGKTIVALMAMVTAVECGCQAALMAPTEILAEQHYLTIHRLVEDLGLSIALLTGSKKDRPLGAIASGEIGIVVGTHALIQEEIRFRRLGIVVIDEQHRFGVIQRSLLRKKGQNPDVLVMTATPIPRTLSMTVYGDLDYSVVDELPPNRTPVVTPLFHSGQKEIIYRAMADEIRKGRQVYVVYPVIEESETSDLKSAVNGKTALEKMFPQFTTGLIHGKMKTAEREAVMTSFKNREMDILVSTTVIEVGVDVPNASMMLIVHAERFGLSQLHQLRGRVGRGSNQSYCLLLAYEPCGEDARRRLDIMVESSDGFRIAEEDLLIRGPGEFLGTRQSGLPDLRVADIIRDADLLAAARNEAFRVVEQDPELNAYPALKRAAERFWEGKRELFRTG